MGKGGPQNIKGSLFLAPKIILKQMFSTVGTRKFCTCFLLDFYNNLMNIAMYTTSYFCSTVISNDFAIFKIAVTSNCNRSATVKNREWINGSEVILPLIEVK
jgi:hypothetical protein